MLKLVAWFNLLGFLLWILLATLFYGFFLCLIKISPLHLAYFPYIPFPWPFRPAPEKDYSLFLAFLMPTVLYCDSFIYESFLLNLSIRSSLTRWCRYLYLFLYHLLVLFIAPLITRLAFTALFSVVSPSTFLPISSEHLIFGLMGFSTVSAGLYLYFAPQSEAQEKIAQTYLSQL
jgi:hypothetical protein